MLLLEDARRAPSSSRRFQQTTGAVMAKGVEDTAFYRYVRLLALNEVGGDPGRFGLTVDEFHAPTRERARALPARRCSPRRRTTPSAAADVRARIVALTRLRRRVGGGASSAGAR